MPQGVCYSTHQQKIDWVIKHRVVENYAGIRGYGAREDFLLSCIDKMKEEKLYSTKTYNKDALIGLESIIKNILWKVGIKEEFKNGEQV